MSSYAVLMAAAVVAVETISMSQMSDSENMLKFYVPEITAAGPAMRLF